MFLREQDSFSRFARKWALGGSFTNQTEKLLRSTFSLHRIFGCNHHKWDKKEKEPNWVISVFDF